MLHNNSEEHSSLVNVTLHDIFMCPDWLNTLIFFLIKHLHFEAAAPYPVNNMHRKKYRLLRVKYVCYLQF
jgi:hypothetical protein